MLAEWGGCQAEDGLFATFTVCIGEVHEDFRTLKEEIQRETQEVEKLSHLGQSSLLTSLSKLLGNRKELQDLELTVRSQGKQERHKRRNVSGGEVCGRCSWWGI